MLVSQSDYTPYRRRKSSFDIRVIATLISLLVIILTGLCVFSVIALRLYYTNHDTITSTSNRTAEYGYLSDGKTQVGLGNSPCSNFKVQVWLSLRYRLMLYVQYASISVYPYTQYAIGRVNNIPTMQLSLEFPEIFSQNLIHYH